jgi:hypothetical protein
VSHAQDPDGVSIDGEENAIPAPPSSIDELPDFQFHEIGREKAGAPSRVLPQAAQGSHQAIIPPVGGIRRSFVNPLVGAIDFCSCYLGHFNLVFHVFF